jgi:excisionase family DNA binding protein
MDDTPSPGLGAHSGRDVDLLRPAEAAALLGVRTSAIARWAREGRLAATATPGGHRRYRRDEILAARNGSTPGEPPAEQTQMEADAVRMYEQGWPIRRVADAFGVSYGVMRRILKERRVLRARGGRAGGGWVGFS